MVILTVLNENLFRNVSLFWTEWHWFCLKLKSINVWIFFLLTNSILSDKTDFWPSFLLWRSSLSSSNVNYDFWFHSCATTYNQLSIKLKKIMCSSINCWDIAIWKKCFQNVKWLWVCSLWRSGHPERK